MTLQQDAAAEDRIRSAVTELTRVFENLGAEHQALTAEEAKTTAKERRGTVICMGEGIAQAARTVSSTIVELATVRGLRDLGVHTQFAKDSQGGDYSPLLTLAGPSDLLYDAAAYLSAAADTLGRAYEPTKKNPNLAVARCPSNMRVVFTSLGAALDAVRADLATDDPELAQEYAAAKALLARLEDRVCRTVPAQGVGPSAEEVAAAIRADPAVVRAAPPRWRRAPERRPYGRCCPREAVSRQPPVIMSSTHPAWPSLTEAHGVRRGQNLTSTDFTEAA
ncbi:hypothetical protein [Streptomyces sp. NPDC094468]|uniref:hypothetical protein n=1 Tax=Streptomyces sp. NPDC094468 TaxID=3366066 RepID=UPI00380FCD95